MASHWCSCLIFLLSLAYQGHSDSSSSSRDRLALLSFKSLITHDPHGALTSWGNSSLHFCLWQGVKCSNLGVQPRVTELALEALDLSGPVSSSIGNLTFLQSLNLPQNQLAGPIPEELGLLSYLQYLNLGFNLLEGVIPHTISQCFFLQSIILANNGLHGEIPSNLSLCPSLRIIDFGENFLSGIIPSSLGALQVLEMLNLSNNILEARKESDWDFLTALSNCTSLQFLDIGANSLGGTLPPTITNLSPNLEILSMESNKIFGAIPPGFSKLVGLQSIFFNGNYLTGPIPAELGILQKLQLLSLTFNKLSGSIPPSIGNISTLEFLLLASNKLEGIIPASFGNLSFLIVLSLDKNNLVGDIPPSLGNLHLLNELYLGYNQLSGSIPESLGNLQSATIFAVNSNELSGEIPHSLWNLSSLADLYLEENMLVGELPQLYIPQNMPHLRYLVLAVNNLYGLIPPSLSNFSALEWIELPKNMFTGTIPIELGNVKRLTKLLLGGNNLEAKSFSDWDFLGALKNCTFLNGLDLSRNERLTGLLPDSVGNLSSLTSIDLSGCQISGSIPAAIGNLISLTAISLESNQFSGSIPESIGKLQMLDTLVFNNNELSAQIPSSFGNLTQLSRLLLSFNNLGGQIPSGLVNCKRLEALELQGNVLTGSIPTEIFAISTIFVISLSDNALEGSLTPEIGSLVNLVSLDISNNNFSGKIPSTLGQCVELQELYMGHNFFEGVIPSSFSLLRSLQLLDLSCNHLSGVIPMNLQDLTSLVYLNLSVNSLEGELPTSGIFRNISIVFVSGNDKLCGGIPEFRLQPCSIDSFYRRCKWTPTLTIVALAVCVAFFVITLILGLTIRRRKLTITFATEEHTIDKHMRISYAELTKATNQFSDENLIGVGSFGSVYKGYMDGNLHKVVAVKVLDLHQKGASRSFDTECEVLKNTRHRNLVSVLTTCSSTDYNGHDFKALVFEFFPNGDLESWLHPKEQSSMRRLSLLQRLNITIDVASALDYLHHHGSEPIVHCDLKPSNVLLDDEMTAHVGDFGLARLLANPKCESSQLPTGSAAVKGTIGYVAPEYGVANKVSSEGDVFSYGIMLLEIFTGKSPIGEILEEGLTLHKFVENAFPQRITEVVDPMLYSRDEDGEAVNKVKFTDRFSKKEMECIISILNIGLSCSKDSPMERMHIVDALNKLHKIRNVLCRVKKI